MDKPSLTIISEKWCDLNPQSTPSINFNTIYKTALSSNLFSSIQYLHLEDIYNQYYIHIDNYLLNQKLHKQTDLYYISWIGSHELNPTNRSLTKIPGKKVFNWPDLVWPWIYQCLDQTNEAATFHTAYDTFNYEGISNYITPKKLYLFGTPQDPTLFYKQEPKDIDVLFSGAEYPDRKPYIDKLRSLPKEIKTYIGTGQRINALTVEDYAGLVRRAKIVVNLPMSPTGINTIKGRVFEALASKALLLELKNEGTEVLFKPNEHYIEFTNEDEMVGKIKYSLEHYMDMPSIADAGYYYYLQNYSAQVYWSNILKTAGLNEQ